MNCLMLTAGIKIFILDLGHLKKGKLELRENKIKRNNSLIDNFMKDLGDNLPQYKHCKFFNRVQPHYFLKSY